MKIRTSFVANSSTTSFCIYGTVIEKAKCEEMELQSSYDSRIRDAGLSAWHNPWAYEYGPYDDMYVGVPWKNVEDEETGAEFKQRVEQLLANLVGEEVECSTIEAAWRDG